MDTSPNRFQAPPLALKAHAALVLIAAFIVWDRHQGGAWVGVVLAALVLWALLQGSRVAWWGQVVGLVAALSSVVEVDGRLEYPVDLTPFVTRGTLLVLSIVLGTALVLLLLPEVRAYRHDVRPVGELPLVIGALVVGGFGGMGLQVESRMPSMGVLEPLYGGTLVAADPGETVGFYVTRRGPTFCLHEVWTDGSHPRCLDNEVARIEGMKRSELCLPDRLGVPGRIESHFCRVIRGTLGT